MAKWGFEIHQYMDSLSFFPLFEFTLEYHKGSANGIADIFGTYARARYGVRAPPRRAYDNYSPITHAFYL